MFFILFVYKTYCIKVSPKELLWFIERENFIFYIYTK